MLLEASKSTLLLVDMQERLLPAMAGGAEVEKRCSILLKAAKALDVPVTVSEQYPKGLGRTVPALPPRSAMPGVREARLLVLEGSGAQGSHDRAP